MGLFFAPVRTGMHWNEVGRRLNRQREELATNRAEPARSGRVVFGNVVRAAGANRGLEERLRKELLDASDLPGKPVARSI